MDVIILFLTSFRDVMYISQLSETIRYYSDSFQEYIEELSLWAMPMLSYKL